MYKFDSKPPAKKQNDIISTQNSNKDELNKSLFRAVFHGDINKVKILLIYGADPNVLAGDDFSIKNKHYPIHIAAYKGFEPIVKLLLSSSAKVDIKAQDGSTPFLMACQQKHKAVMHLLLEANPSLVNDSDDAGETALIIAAGTGNRVLIELLLSKGADINKVTTRGASPLFIAVQQGYEDVARLLIDNDAEIYCKRKLDDATALHMAVITNQLDMILLLICKGGDIASKNLEGVSVQELASKQNIQIQSAVKGYKIFLIEEVLRLIQAELAVYHNSSPAYNWLIKLQLAVKLELSSDEFFKKLQSILKDVKDSNYVVAGDQLKKFKSNIIVEMNRYNKFKIIDQQPPNLIKLINEPVITLSIAIQKGFLEKVKTLVNKDNIDVLIDDENNTPLLLALKLGFYVIAKYLIENGANVHKEDKYGLDALDICPESVITHIVIGGFNASRGKAQISQQVESIKRYKLITNSLWNPSFHGLKAGESLKYVLSTNCNLEEKNNQGMTPLLQAAMKKGTYKTLMVLIKAGANLDAKNKNGKGLKDIIENCLRGKLPIHKINKLYKKISEINKEQQKNILVQAVSSSYYNLAQRAIWNGENVNQLAGKDEETPLFIAIKQENWVIAKLLIDNGANLNVTTKSGLTIKTLLAKMAISQDIISVLFDNITNTRISLPHGNYSPILFSNQNEILQQNKINSDDKTENDTDTDPINYAKDSNNTDKRSKTMESSL